MLPDSARDTEWTPGRGLRRAALGLLIKSVVCLAVWAGFLVVTEPGARWLSAHITPRGAVGITALVAGIVFVLAWPMGRWLSRRLTDDVGFAGPVPAGLGCAAVWIVALAGSRLAELITGPGTWIATVATVGLGVEASVIVLWRTWVDPE